MVESNQKDAVKDEELDTASGGKNHDIPSPSAPNTGNCLMCNTSDHCVIVNFKRTYDNCKDCRARNS